MFRHTFGYLVLVASSAFLWDNRVDGALSKAQLENAGNNMRKLCVQKTGVDADLAAGARNGVFPEDELFQCYLKCVMSTGQMMKNDQPAVDKIVKQMKAMLPAASQERSIAATTKCKATEIDDNPCVTAWRFVKCQYEADPEVFFFP